MAERKVNRLTTKQCDAAKEPGMYPDGDGLYLQIGAKGGKSWLLRYRFGDKRKEMGLGSYSDLGLKDARSAAEAARAMLRDGRDPIVERKLAEAKISADDGAPEPLFGEFARGLMSTWLEEFKSKPHRQAWRKTFGALPGEKEVKKPYAGLILDKRIADIDAAAVLAVVQPLWKRYTTASRVLGRIERVLDAASVLNYRAGENPARWEGHLEHVLTRPKKMARGHHKAMPYAEMPMFMKQLQALEWIKMAGKKADSGKPAEMVAQSVSVLALEFLILTAARTSEVTLAPRSEIDFAKRVWIIPKERMKEGREHRVPLSDRAIEILRKVWPFSNRPDAYIFRGQSGDGHLSNMALSMCLRGLVGDACTVHGFRSTFRDWAGDETDFPREVAEAALSHLVGDQAEQAYRRGDALERRRKLMDAWADYLANDTSIIV